MKSVLITGADRGIGFALCQVFVEHGWKVFAGQFMTEWKELEGLKEKAGDQLELIPLNVGSNESVEQAAALIGKLVDSLDILANCAGISGRIDDRAAAVATWNVNTLGPIRMVEAFLPLLEKGMRRLCFVSSEAGSISVAHRKDGFSYCLSKTALNMAVRLMFNELQPEGYTFRLYHPGWVRTYMMGKKSTLGNFEPEETAATAYAQFTSERAWEDTLIMTDVVNQVWPF